MTIPHKFMRVFTYFFFFCMQLLKANVSIENCKSFYPSNLDYHDVLVHLNIDTGVRGANTLNELNNRLDSYQVGSMEYIHLEYAKSMYFTYSNNKHLSDSIVEKYLYRSDVKYCEHLDKMLGGYIYRLSGKDRYTKLLDVIDFLQKQKVGLPDEFIYKKLADLFYHLGQYELAAEHFLVLLEIGKKQPLDRASCYNNLGLCYENIRDLDKAKEAYKKAIGIMSRITNESDFQKKYNIYFTKLIENNLMELNVLGENADSILYQNTLKEYELSFIDGLCYGGVGVLYQLADYAFKTKDYSNAINYVNLINEKTKHGKKVPKEKLPEYYKLLSQKYGKEGFINKMIYYGNLSLKALLKQNEDYKELYSATIPLDKEWTAKMLLEREKALKAENKVKMLSYLLLSILLVLIVIIYFSYIKQKKSGIIIRRKNKIIEDALKTSKMLLKEMHHRVKNNLQLVSSIAYIEYEQNDEQFDFERFENRIISLSLIHRLLYSTKYTEHIDCKSYLEDLLGNLQNTADKPFEFVLNIDDLKLKSDQMISMGLLINELVINTVKHCNPIEGEDVAIHLSLNRVGEQLKLSYTDNGTTYNTANKTESYSLGQNLIDLLIQKLKGKSTLRFDSGYNLTVLMK